MGCSALLIGPQVARGPQVENAREDSDCGSLMLTESLCILEYVSRGSSGLQLSQGLGKGA